MADGQVIIDDNGGSNDAVSWTLTTAGTVKTRNADESGALQAMDKLKQGFPQPIPTEQIFSVEVTAGANPPQKTNVQTSVEISCLESAATGAGTTTVTLTVANSGSDISVTPSESLVERTARIYETNLQACINTVTVDGVLFFTRQGSSPTRVRVKNQP